MKGKGSQYQEGPAAMNYLLDSGTISQLIRTGPDGLCTIELLTYNIPQV